MTLEIEPLSREGFRVYGEYQNLYDIEPYRKTPPGDSGFYPDIMTLNLGRDTLPALCVSKIRKRPMKIETMEYHRRTAEFLLPLDADCVIFVGQACKSFDPSALRCFRVPKGTAVRLNPGVIHGTQFVLGQEWARVLILLPEHTYDNDVVKMKLDTPISIRNPQ